MYKLVIFLFSFMIYISEYCDDVQLEKCSKYLCILKPFKTKFSKNTISKKIWISLYGESPSPICCLVKSFTITTTGQDVAPLTLAVFILTATQTLSARVVAFHKSHLSETSKY